MINLIFYEEYNDEYTADGGDAIDALIDGKFDNVTDTWRCDSVDQKPCPSVIPRTAIAADEQVVV